MIFVLQWMPDEGMVIFYLGSWVSRPRNWASGNWVHPYRSRIDRGSSWRWGWGHTCRGWVRPICNPPDRNKGHIAPGLGPWAIALWRTCTPIQQTVVLEWSWRRARWTYIYQKKFVFISDLCALKSYCVGIFLLPGFFFLVVGFVLFDSVRSFDLLV